MGIWDSILKYGGKAAKATGRSMGHAALHPSQTLRGTGQAVKTAAIGGAVGYVGWEKLTTDKSVVHIVSDAVIGKSATDTLADAADGVRELTSKAGEAVGSVSGTVAGIDSKLGGVSNFLRQVSNGGVSDMFGNFFRNLGQGNVSGLSIAGLVAAAFLIFGRFGWLGKIAGAFLGMMLIGNNAGIFRTPDTRSIQRIQTPALPVEEQTGKDVKLSLGYGEQTDPTTGKTYFHHGIDFDVRCYTLAAVASGIVSGIGNDPILGICQTIRYGEYEVTYGHLSNVFAQFGQRVKAGQTVALSGDKLHIGIRFKGEELNPLEFLTMLYGNIQALCHADGGEAATSPNMEMALTTDYEQDRQEIEELMLRFLPYYMEDLQRGAYRLPPHTEQSLRHVFTMGAVKEYFYENMPSISNPLGLGHKAMPLACKVQNLLIADFLHYLALRHGVYLSTMGDDVKKNSTTKP